MNNSDKFFLPAKSRILTGKELADWLVCSYTPKDSRRAYRSLQAYIQGEYPDHVCVLHGLSGTGKKSLMRRAMLELPTDQTVYINIKEGEKSKDVVELVREMIEKHNIVYVFIVNVTRIEDFVGIDIMLEHYCNHSVRIVITGDSGLALSVGNKHVYLDKFGNEIIPKIYKIDTTKISFHEHTMMTGNDTIDHYVIASGTCPTEDRGESGKTIFEQEKLVKSYVSTAIASNVIVGADIEKQCGNNYSMIRSIAGCKNAITNILNNIVYNMVHEVTNKKTTDKHIYIDTNENNDYIKRTSSSEIFHALRETGAISIYNNCFFSGSWELSYRLHLTQPGLCYWIAEKYVCDSFGKEDTKQILSKVRARILEEMVVFWFMQGGKENLVYRLSIGNSGTAVVVRNLKNFDNFYLYEFIHSDADAQTVILGDEKLCATIEKKFGSIDKRAIIWKGKDIKDSKFECINVCKLLE